MKITQLSALCLAFAATIATISSCNIACTHGSGKLVTENRGGGAFSKLDIAGPFNVTVKQDSITSVKITGDDNLMQKIKSSVSGDELLIKTESGVCPSGQIAVVIGVKNLSEIKTAGAINLNSDGKITAKDLELDFSGATTVDMALNADNVTTTGSGMTKLNLSGQAASHKIDFSGAGEVNALDFVVSKYEIQSSGAGNFKINVLNDLDVNSSGASDIQYRGNPKNIKNDKSGIGTLKKID